MARRIPVLIIDDDEGLMELLEYNLRLDGFELQLASDGLSGIDSAIKHRPAVILLDISMPGMDGLEVLSELKYKKKTENIPVFMLTAKGKICDMDRAFDIGADGYITKPIDAAKLGKLVKMKLVKYQKSKISN